MSKFGDQYALDRGRSGHDRLRVISEIHDPQTRVLLKRAGLAPGHRYAEFGCGLGYVTRWAATEGAHATGIDLSEDQVDAASRLAEETQLPNVDFRVASIYEHGLEPESIDISYSRWLLVHLNRPVEAMRRIYEALKPGGVMVCEEADLSGIYSEPESAYSEMRDFALEGGRRRGVDYTGGRRAHRWAKEAGFEIVHVDAYQPHYLDGPFKGFWNWTFREASTALIAAGIMDADKVGELVEDMKRADACPETVVAHSRMHQLIARKPG
jgi:SAM-dependent methyltransferase